MSSIKVANAPCSWGALEFNQPGKAPGFVRVLDELAGSGYSGTELGDWGFMPTEPQALKAELERRALAMLGAFVPVALKDERTHAKGEAEAVKTARLLAEVGEAPFLVLADENGAVPERTRSAGRVAASQGLSDGEWRTFAKGANRIASAVREATGVRTVFHHHCAGYVETPGEVDRLMELTDPKLVGLCLDLGHFAFGGGEPLTALRRYRDRIWHVHFKDCEPEVAARSRREGWDYFESIKAGVFCELGKGYVDFGRIVSELKESRYQGWVVVEQDVLPGMGTPLESARRNREFLKSLGL